MNRRWLLLIPILLLALWWLWPHPKVAHLTPREGPIIVLGDSLAAGVGSENGLGYVGVLQKRLGIEIVNRGISGDTTAQGLARLQKDVLSQHPALVIVELGGNDFLQKLPPEQTASNLDLIVEHIQAQKAAVLLLGAQSGLFSNRASKMYAELARRRQTGLVLNVLDGILTRADLKADAIHPNQRGYEAMADKIEPELRYLLKKMKRI